MKTALKALVISVGILAGLGLLVVVLAHLPEALVGLAYLLLIVWLFVLGFLMFDE